MFRATPCRGSAGSCDLAVLLTVLANSVGFKTILFAADNSGSGLHYTVAVEVIGVSFTVSIFYLLPTFTHNTVFIEVIGIGFAFGIFDFLEADFVGAFFVKQICIGTDFLEACLVCFFGFPVIFDTCPGIAAKCIVTDFHGIGRIV